MVHSSMDRYPWQGFRFPLGRYQPRSWLVYVLQMLIFELRHQNKFNLSSFLPAPPNVRPPQHTLPPMLFQRGLGSQGNQTESSSILPTHRPSLNSNSAHHIIPSLVSSPHNLSGSHGQSPCLCKMRHQVYSMLGYFALNI
jgi:hypothetical protein